MSDDERENPIDALAELFAEPDAEPSPGFVDRLETDLRIAHAERNRGRQGAPLWGRVGALASMAVVVLAIATAGLLFRDRSVSSALELSNARGVVVTLPDGSVVADPADGFDLPEGTVIVVQIGGSATIDDVSLTAGSMVTVRDGALVTEVPVTTTVRTAEPRPGSVGSDAAQPPPDRMAQPDQPMRDDEPSATDRPDKPTDSMQRGEPMTSLPPIEESSPAPTDAPRTVPPAGTDRPGPMITVPADRAAPGSGLDLGLRLRLDGRSHRVRLEWSTGPAADPTWRVVVVRTAGDVVPDWPLVPGAVVVGESSGPGRSEAMDMLNPAVGVVNYRVLVLDGAGGVVARGVVQSVDSAGR